MRLVHAHAAGFVIGIAVEDRDLVRLLKKLDADRP